MGIEDEHETNYDIFFFIALRFLFAGRSAINKVCGGGFNTGVYVFF